MALGPDELLRGFSLVAIKLPSSANFDNFDIFDRAPILTHIRNLSAPLIIPPVRPHIGIIARL